MCCATTRRVLRLEQRRSERAQVLAMALDSERSAQANTLLQAPVHAPLVLSFTHQLDPVARKGASRQAVGDARRGRFVTALGVSPERLWRFIATALRPARSSIPPTPSGAKPRQLGHRVRSQARGTAPPLRPLHQLLRWGDEAQRLADRSPRRTYNIDVKALTLVNGDDGRCSDEPPARRYPVVPHWSEGPRRVPHLRRCSRARRLRHCPTGREFVRTTCP